MGLETKLKTLEDRFDAVQDTSADAAEKSASAAEKAYGLLVSDLTLPDINVAELQNKIESVSDKVNQLISKLILFCFEKFEAN